MQYLIPDTKKKTVLIFGLTGKDILFIVGALIIAVLIGTSTLSLWVKLVLGVVLLVITIFAVVTIDGQKGWRVLINFFRYITRRKSWAAEDITKTLEITDHIHYIGGVYTAVIQLNGLNFSILSEDTQNTKIVGLMQVLQELRGGKIMKLEEPIDFTPYIEHNNEYIAECEDLIIRESQRRWGGDPDRWQTLENEPAVLKKKILENQNKHLTNFNDIGSTVKSAYYLLIHETSEEALKIAMTDAINGLRAIGLYKDIIRDDDKGPRLTDFLKRVLSFKSDVSSVQGLRLERMQEKANRCIIDGETYQTICVRKYKMLNDNAWGWKLFNIPDVRVTVNFRPYAGKSVEKLINKQFSELRMRMEDSKTKEFEQNRLSGEYQAISAMVNDLQFGLDRLFDVEFYITYPIRLRKFVSKQIRAQGIIASDCYLTQFESYANTLPFLPIVDKKTADSIVTFPCSALAGMFPFVIKELFDPQGSFLGGSAGLPVFFDLFHRDDDRKNSNAAILGAPGGGKSYFIKKQLLRMYTQGVKLYILDPENEYKRFSEVFGADYIDLSGLKDQVINPLQVFPAFTDDTDDRENKAPNEVSAHLVFLEQFFQTILPDLGAYQKDLLMNYITGLYAKWNIRDGQKISDLPPEKFPTFSDLMKVILARQAELIKNQRIEEEYELRNLNPLIMAIKKFTEGGIYASLWNGKTTLKLVNDFTVFNFQTLFASGNNTVVNAQMLLVIKFLNQEVIKNREENDKHIVIAIDEAHRFINGKFTVGLDFMQQEAKQIRKYYGSLIIATQNINDFCGGSEEMRQKAAAVINCCQYSFVFNLAPDDINQIVKLYQNYNGGLQQEEINFIAAARRGDCLFLASKDIRLPVHITTFPGEDYYYELPQGNLAA